MKNITAISILFLLFVSSCSSIKQFRYMSKAEAPKGTFRIEVPFETFSNLIIMKVKLNNSDKEYDFLLDSGAPVSVIYSEALNDIKPDTVMTYGISDSQGNSTKSIYVNLDMTIGNGKFKEVFTAYSDPHDLLKCIASGGIIGADLMQTANWDIDFEKKKIIITDFKSDLPNLDEYQTISCTKRAPFTFAKWLTVLPGMTVDLKIKDTKFKDVYVDLGSSGGLTLANNSKTKALFKDDLNETMYGFSSFGLLGSKMDTTYSYNDAVIDIEGVKIKNQPIDIYNRKSALLGMAVFSDYHLIMDFEKNKLYLKPTAKADEATAASAEFGFRMYYDMKTKSTAIVSIMEGSAAQTAGLQLNDTVVEINGSKIPELDTFCEFREWFKQLSDENTTLTVKIARREEVYVLEKGLIPRK